MNKVVLSSTVAFMLLMSNCANNTLSLNSISTPDTNTTKADVKLFKTGVVINSQKVLINDRKIAMLTGAAVGAGAGAVATQDVAKTGLSGLVGAGVGYIVGKEVEAYLITIQTDDNKRYKAYVTQDLQKSTTVEFVVDENNVTHVNVKQSVDYTTLEDAIDKRYFKNNFWYYHLRHYDITVRSLKKYYYLYDAVRVKFDESSKKIISIEKLRSNVISPHKKPKPVVKHATKPKPVTTPTPKPKPVATPKPTPKPATKSIADDFWE